MVRALLAVQVPLTGSFDVRSLRSAAAINPPLPAVELPGRVLQLKTTSFALSAKTMVRLVFVCDVLSLVGVARVSCPCLARRAAPRVMAGVTLKRDLSILEAAMVIERPAAG